MLFRKKNKISQIAAQKTDEKLRVYLPRVWPYRFIGNILILSLITAISLGFYIAKTNFVEQKLISISDYLLNITTQIGFTIDDILISGRVKTPLEEVNNVVNLHRGDNILGPDIHQLQADLEQLPWVKSATVKRSYMPNIINIDLTERQIQAIWQINGKFYPVDSDGNTIDTDQIPNIPLLLIIGPKAPQNLNKLISVIKSDPDIYSRVKAANFISERRWNIILDDIENGITVKLPADDVDKAWKKLLKLNKTRGLLKRKLTIIDLRFDNKVLVTPRKLSSDKPLTANHNKEQKI